MPAVMQDCVEHLKETFGARYVVGKADGRSRMSRQLHKHFKLSGREADTLLAELERTGAIRYVGGGQRILGRNVDPYRDPSKGPTPVIGQDLATEVPIELPVGGEGCWQIGED